MEKKDYYIERTYSRTTNKKEKAPNLFLRTFHYTLVTFTDDYTIKDFEEVIKTQLSEINMISHGRDVTYRLNYFNDMYSFAFEPVPSRGEAIASMTLHPVKSYITK